MSYTKLAVRHLSVRVPWHDAGWAGTVCEDPASNVSCLVLDRIRKARQEEEEEHIAGQSLAELSRDQLPSCVLERACFMAPFELVREVEHAYSKTSDLHRHLLPTPLRLPKYSAGCIPFRWMLKENAWEISNELNLDCSDKYEPELPFSTVWVQSFENQKVLLKTFFSAIVPETSLCFFYAKRTPLAEDNRRVLVGVGRVKHVGRPEEFRRDKKQGLRGMIWDVPVQHSIRLEFKDGFILPYQKLLELSQPDSTLNLAEYVAFVPNEHRGSFSYASEHVNNDAAIAALLSLADVVRRMSKVLDQDWQPQLRWIDERLAELWKLRGPYPGLGATLCAFGVEYGSLLAYELQGQLQENEDPWVLVDRLFKGQHALPSDFPTTYGKTLREKWIRLPDERRSLLKLLSRFELTVSQATRFYIAEERQKARIDCSDRDILENPYLLYEKDRFSVDPISLMTIDRGMFPEQAIRIKHPLSPPSLLDGSTDPRRVRAFVVDVLEKQRTKGDTLLPQAKVITYIRDLAVVPSCPVDQDLLRVVEQYFGDAVIPKHMQDGSRAYQLGEMAKMGDLIRRQVEKRRKGKRHVVEDDWRERLDSILGPVGDSIPASIDEQARVEKAAALKELAEARVSVLIGPAGTGKTTLLATLCNHPAIAKDGVLLLAPTGKARVKLQTATKLKAHTVAQFLRQHDRYDEQTGIYHLSEREKVAVAKTVVIDESSMLTEDQLAALLDALKGVSRLILVGDPRQLPPIGAGRPFVDIVQRLVPDNINGPFPKVDNSYAELTISCRHAGQNRDDLQLAEWFSGKDMDSGNDDVFSRISLAGTSDHVRVVAWKTPDELELKLHQVLVEELGLDGTDDEIGFEVTLGGNKSGNYVYFNRGSAVSVENWQILSPLRGTSLGTETINWEIQRTFRRCTIAAAQKRFRRIPRPMGSEGIVYGDKVINLRNHRRIGVYPKDKEVLEYVANGEIGLVVGQLKTKKSNYRGLPWQLHVEFSSQLGYTYDFGGRDFGEESSPYLELAYAITVHKSQSSEFGLVLLVLPDPCWLLSRELIYTALTRQKERIVILYQGDIHNLKKYSSAYYSETAGRLTDLFYRPGMRQIKDKFLEERLIHCTRNGELVRSKSEVIIADQLSYNGIGYIYEQPLQSTDGSIRYPDFTIEDSESGVMYYWEHSGMFYEPSYQKRWKEKLKWYKTQGILTLDEGGGEKGTLLVTKDGMDGGINSQEIEELIRHVF